MLRLLTKARGRRPAVWLAASAAALGLFLIPGAASASSTQPLPTFVVWQPGTPLPAVPAGYHIQAWPSQRALAGISPGQEVPTTMVDTSGATASLTSALQADTNYAGLVNLEIAPGPDACAEKFLKNVGSESTNVLQSYSTISRTSQSFTYGNDQSSSLGVGVSTSNESSGFSASGTASVSTNGAQGFPTQSGKSYNHWETYFEVGEWVEACSTGGEYIIKPYQWNAGTKIVHPSGAPAATHCVPEDNGSNFSQAKTKATTFSVGFNVLGFNGQAQTGYSATAEINFKYTENAQLCGTVNDPGATGPGVLVAS